MQRDQSLMTGMLNGRFRLKGSSQSDYDRYPISRQQVYRGSAAKIVSKVSNLGLAETLARSARNSRLRVPSFQADDFRRRLFLAWMPTVSSKLNSGIEQAILEPKAIQEQGSRFIEYAGNPQAGLASDTVMGT